VFETGLASQNPSIQLRRPDSRVAGGLWSGKCSAHCFSVWLGRQHSTFFDWLACSKVAIQPDLALLGRPVREEYFVLFFSLVVFRPEQVGTEGAGLPEDGGAAAEGRRGQRRPEVLLEEIRLAVDEAGARLDPA
jgi:hypothetical protein